MVNIDITSMSSRGQIVIPQGLRKKLKIENGEKFVVLGKDNTIVLKKIDAPSFDGFDELLKKTRKFVKEKGIEERDLDEAVKSAKRR